MIAQVQIPHDPADLACQGRCYSGRMDILASGHPCEPSLHDGHLLGLDLVRKAVLHVRLRNLAGKGYLLELSGLRQLRCGEFREGNIVLDVEIMRGTPSGLEEANTREALVRSLVGELHPTVQDPFRSKNESYIVNLLTSIKDGNLTLVRIDASYGCELTALCERAAFL